MLGLQQQHLTQKGISIRTGKTGKKMLFKWTPALRAVVEYVRALRGDVISMYLICRRDGQRYTGLGFRAMWNRVMRNYVKNGGEHFTFHDIRAKSGSDTDDDKLLGHQDPRTLHRVYKRKPTEVTPLSRPLKK